MAMIHWIDQPSSGRLGVMARPGRHDSPEHDLAQVRDAGVDVLVSLLTPDEARDGLQNEAEVAKGLGMQFKSFPIQDRSCPPLNAETLRFLRARLKEIESGKTVVFHCSSGRGRTGLVGASLLVMQGIEPHEAIKQVRGHRLTPVPDTKEQKDWIRNLARNLGVPVHAESYAARNVALAAAAFGAVAAIWVWRRRASSN